MRRILLVDDSRGVRRKLEASLVPWGFEVLHAENGAKALGWLKSAQIDLVFLDINMPVLDGPGLLRVMRSQGLDAPVVLVTSGATALAIAAAVKLGAAEYVSKPFTAQQIRDVVARVLHFDASTLSRFQPRLLAAAPENSFVERLREWLPQEIEFDRSSDLSEALGYAERGAYGLVLLDAEALESAQRFRERQPMAGLFGVVPVPRGSDRIGEPDGPLDGLVPFDLDEPLLGEFLIPIFLRPIVSVEAGVLRASAFEGSSRFVPAYFRQLERVLRSRGEQEARVAPDISLDLGAVPLDAELLAGLIQRLGEHFERLEAAAAFSLTREQHALMSGREETSRVVLLDPP